MSKITNVPSIHEDKIEFARGCIEHRATWMALTYLEAKNMGYDAEKMTREAVKKCGKIHGLGYKSQCSNPEDLDEFNKVFLHEDGKKNFEIEVVEVDKDNIKAEFHYCALVNAWQKLGIEGKELALLCDIAMDGDRGIAESMGIKLNLTDTIAKGCKTCKLHFHK